MEKETLGRAQGIVRFPVVAEFRLEVSDEEVLAKRGEL
jgi:hypothetical protein